MQEQLFLHIFRFIAYFRPHHAGNLSPSQQVLILPGSDIRKTECYLIVYPETFQLSLFSDVPLICFPYKVR